MQESRPSKSQKKREMLELQSIGEKLIDLKVETLEKFTLSDALTNAIHEAKRIKSREALRRQKQYIGKLMKGEDIEGIQAIFNQLEIEQNTFNQHFQELESMRDSLLQGGVEAINSVIARIPEIDRQKLRQLTKKAKAEISKQLPPQHQRQLFRFLRESMKSDD